jgi:hypothetical protein
MKKDPKIEKEAITTSTTPLYITTDPVKGKVFTAADIVSGKGKLTHNGKSFVPKKWKAHSLSDKVTSKEFGKVRK